MVDYGWSWLITSSFERHNFALDGILFPEMDGDIWRHGDDSNDSQGVTAGLGECLVYESISIATYRGMWEIYGNIWKYVIEHQLFKVTLKLSPWPAITDAKIYEKFGRIFARLPLASVVDNQAGWEQRWGSHHIFPVAFSILGTFGGVLNCIAKGCQIKRIFVAKRWCLNPRHRFWAQILTRILPKRHDGRQMVGSIVRSRWFRINANPD